MIKRENKITIQYKDKQNMRIKKFQINYKKEQCNFIVIRLIK